MQYYLIKFMEVEIPLLTGGIPEMEVVIVFFKVSFSAETLIFFHIFASPATYSKYSAVFASFQAQDAIYFAVLCNIMGMKVRMKLSR